MKSYEIRVGDRFQKADAVWEVISDSETRCIKSDLGWSVGQAYYYPRHFYENPSWKLIRKSNKFDSLYKKLNS